MRAAVLLALLFSVAPPAAAQSDSTWRQHDRSARQAYHDGDFATVRAQLLAMRREIGPLPRIDYGLAVAEARLGNGGRALEWLEIFADMGLWRDASHDADLASVRDQAGYLRIAAQLAANLAPIERGAVAFTLPDADLVAEDIAYDTADHRFFVSSVHRRKIIVVDSAGHVSDFTRPGADGTWAMLALAVDPARRLLWATTVALNAAEQYSAADSGRSALLAYDLATGALRARLDPPPAPGGHSLGDMTLDPDGTVYVSDGAAGTVYRAAPGAHTLEALVPPATLLLPQTPALSADGRRLFVPDYARGIAVIDLATRAVAWLPHPGNVALTGIDGLYRVDGTMIAIQNGPTPNRVLRVLFDDAMTRVLGADVLERGVPVLDDPTHGVMIGDAFYFIARSGWSRVRDDGTMSPAGAGDAPVVRRMVLPH
jgi:hypothetical protein